MIKVIVFAAILAVVFADSPHAEMEKAKNRWIKHNKDSLIPITEEVLHEEGIYARGLLPQAGYKGSTRAKKLWVRPFTVPGADGYICCSELGPVRYHVRGFEVDKTGHYEITSLQQAPKREMLEPWDGVLFLYEGTFAPGAPTENLIASNDDYMDDSKYMGMSVIPSVELKARTRYILVTSGYSQHDRGVFNNRIGAIDHDGSVDLDETSCADVGCSYIASSDCSCDDICLEFGDCCFDYCFECTDMPAPPGNELCASVSGDPHFHGRFGETYDVRGEANEVFNILSDHNMQLNTRYVSGCRSHSTVLGELGLLFNEQELYFSADEATLGGERMDVGRRHYLGEAKESWAEMQPNDQLLIVTPDYSLRFLRTQSKKCDLKHVDMQLHFRNEEARPHGLLGQTARESPMAKRDVHGRIDQGQEILEGEWHHYKVAEKDLFGTEFRYNRYGNSEAPKSRSAPKARPADFAAEF